MAEFHTLPVYKAAIELERQFSASTQKTPRRLKYGKVDVLHRDLVDYLLRVIIFRNPTEGCIKIGDPKDWDRLPPHKSLFHSPIGSGLTIGDVTSQLFSNIYLNPLDQFVKRSLKCRYYGRYVDDIRIVGHDKKESVRTAVAVDSFLRHKLGLRLNHGKAKVVRADKTVGFLGAELRKGRRYAAGNTIKKFAQKTFEGQSLSVINSYLGYLKHFRADKITRKIIQPLVDSGRYMFANNFNKVTFKDISL